MATSARSPAMPVDDPPYIGEADAGPFELIVPVKALKDAEQFVDILHVEADPVVAHEHRHLGRAVSGCANLDARDRPRRRELDGIRQQVHEDLAQHGRITRHIGQRANCPGDGLVLQV